ncbi:hypothetical protein KIN20_028200 [Parelaphostrongylus tenuis]|uniref:non-specific protein-tyrosine kinase n=1 Tax=Parelaphostrongylus tenuis TaxID=148309 RepID=A0AAD5WEH8_PARTN|nr:hypothetical protein KIN20_028200 [Parelaphostrongylus tenuis]
MSSNAMNGVMIEENLMEVLNKARVDHYRQAFVYTLQIRRVDQIPHFMDADFQSIGMSLDEIRSLRRVSLDIQIRENRRNVAPRLVCVPYGNVVNQQSTFDSSRVLIPATQVVLLEVIGQGTFSVVKRGYWYQRNGVRIEVALKILREVSPSILADLREEANHLLKLRHNNLVRLHGIVENPVMMVFELCEGGELLTRLRDTRKPVPLVTTLLGYCLQVVRALNFLESKQLVHRDIAARNILLTRDERVAKLCDFGLMRSLRENERTYVMQSHNRVPFSWLVSYYFFN